jgi:succinoglycan biosynthesis transport protein ExoP
VPPFTLLDMLRAVRRRWWHVLLLVVSAIALAIGISWVLPKKYEAMTSLFPPASLEIFSLGEPVEMRTRGPQVPVSTEDQLRGFFGVLRSRALAEMVMKKIPQRDLPTLMKNTRITLTKYNLFQLVVLDEDPEMAALIANTYAESFNDLFEQISLLAARRTRVFIASQLDRTKEDLLVAEERVRRYREAQRVVSLPEETTEMVKRLAALRAEQDATRTRLGEMRERIAQAEARLRDEARTQVSAEVIQNNPVVEQQEVKLAALEVELAAVLSKFTPLHPEAQRLRGSIEEARKQLQREARRILGSQTTSLNAVHQALRQTLVESYLEEKALQWKMQEIQRNQRKAEEDFLHFPKVSVDLAQMLRDVHHREEAARVLALKLEEAKIQELREVQNFVVVDKAKPSATPASPNMALNVIVAFALSTFVGLCYAIFLGYLESQRLAP